MQKINLNQSNVFESRQQAFYNSRLSERLKAKYEDKPYEIEAKPLFLSAKVTSYLCNAFSALTASIFVFTFLVNLLSELPYHYFLAGIFTLFILPLIEIVQRVLGLSLFKKLYQYGFDFKQLRIVLGLVFFASLSIYSSFNGGYDLVNTLSSPPIPQEAELYDIEEMKQDYNNRITESKTEAEAYKKSKLWLGRLSDKSAKHYKELLSVKSSLENKLLEKTNEYEQLNRDAKTRIKAENEKALLSYETRNVNKGGGLGKFTLLSVFIFYLCIWFMERYDYLTASQYSLINKGAHNIQPQEMHAQRAINEPVLTPIAQPKHVATNKQDNRRNIGFNKPKPPQDNNLWQQEITGAALPVVNSSLQRPEKQEVKTVFVSDKNTVSHQKTNGDIVYLNRGQVKSRIKTYQDRVKEAEARMKIADNEEAKTVIIQTRNNRVKTLNYWLGKLGEFK